MKKIAILTCVTLLLFSCSSTKKSTPVVKKKSPTKNVELTDLPEKEQIKFKYLFHDANKERILENYQMAANYFIQCTKIAPNESAPYYELAHLFEGSNEKELALKYAEKAVKLDPENYWYRIIYAHALQRTGNSIEAIKQYEMLIENNDANIDLYFDLAGMQRYARKYKESIATYNIIEKKLGISEEISVQKEMLYVKLGDIDKAANEIELLIKEYPEELKFQVLLADLYMANDLVDKAFVVYTTILEKDPENPYAHLSLYDYYKGKQEEQKASESLKRAFGCADLDIDTKMKILLSYFSTVDKAAKKEAYELNKILIKTHPKEAKAYTIYADFLYQDKKLEGAKENYLKALEFDQTKLPIWNQLMFIESELNDTESLLRDSKAALELFPNQPLFYFFYGSSQLQKKEFKIAAEYLSLGKDYVIENPPLLAQFYASLGDAYHGSKEYEKSDEAYENSLKIEPKNIYVLNNYGYYLSLREEKLERAEELSSLCNELEPDQPNYQDTYAWILYKQGKYIQAKDWLEKAIASGGGKNAVILEHLGDVYAQLKNIAKALEYWNKAKALGDVDSTSLLNKKIADKKLYE